MQLLREKILSDGKYLGKGILKVDSFMNHQIDSGLMKSVGDELASRFAGESPTRILTAETSGIAPALATGIALGVPVVFARKHRPVTMAGEPYRERAESHTHGRQVELLVSPEYLKAADRVLIIDDFLATARTIEALVRLIEQSGATLVGIGSVIEKAFEGGRHRLLPLNVRIESLAIIKNFDQDKINLADVN